MKTAMIVTILLASCLAQLANAIGSEALWQPGMSTMQSIRDECAKAAQFNECFYSMMQKSGASPQAVAFTKLTEQMGYMRDFLQAGHVDVAFVNFPFRANENQGAYLVNGAPSMIDIDDQRLLSPEELKKNSTYAALAKQYSDVTIWPGNRNGTDYLEVKSLPDGGQEFIAEYILRNGCHACATIGTARFAFDFDSTGKFLGTKLVNVTKGSAISR
jgi:hypothetical protein